MNDVSPKRRFRRWIFPVLSLFPLTFGIIDRLTMKGSGDEIAGAGMAVVFFLFPTSFILALVAAGITWARWKTWTRMDRVIGLAPVSLLLLVTLVAAVFVIFALSR